MSSAESAAWASVVIPAHNEEKVIGACLDALLGQVPPDRTLEVVVAANGCSDRTVQIAESYAGVRVLDLDVASKHAALNGGEAACTAFPRIYLDADIVLGPGSLAGLVETLSTALPRVASPHIRFHTADSSAGVRAFYRVFERLPYVTDGLVGLGVYGISREGRRRFGELPALQADDLFVQRTFGPSERIVSPGTFLVQTPRNLRSLVKVRTRIATGNAELADAMARPDGEAPDEGDYASSSAGTLRSLVGLGVRHPRSLPDIAVYVAVTVAARLRARRLGTAAWERDSSTR